MPYKVRCKMVAFTGDPERFPCHFGYKIGDEFTYDGEKFEGRVCNGVLRPMASVVWNTLFYGYGDYDRMIYLYSGLSAADPAMKKYDGAGFRPLKKAPEGADPRYLSQFSAKLPGGLIKRTPGFTCEDGRTGAHFVCEPCDLANGGDLKTYYKRAMAILEKIRQQPGMTVKEILGQFTRFEREEIYPPIYDVNVSLMLEEMATVNYIDLKDGRAYPRRKNRRH